MSKAKERDFHNNFGGIGFVFFPYQIAFGISFRYWSCISAPAFRLYFGPFKMWGYVNLKKKD